MSEKKKKGVVPRLRFPEFRDAGPWEVKRLREVAINMPPIGGKTAKDFGHGSGLYVTYMNVYEHTFVDSNSLEPVDIGAEETQTIIQPGDMLFTVSSETPEDAGLSAVVIDIPPRCYVNSFCTIYRPRENAALSAIFAGYYLRAKAVRTHFTHCAQGAIRFNLNRKAFDEAPLMLPCLSEQQKIADCLSSLDALIELEGKKLEALKAHKKGLMQQLFPREGETAPRLRFPEFRDAGPWEVKRLGEVANRITEKAGSLKLAPVSISAGKGFVTQKEKFGRDISGRQYKNYIRLKKGQFAYNKGNSKVFPQGAVYQLSEFDEAAVPNAFYCFEFKVGYVPEFFIGYFENNVHGKQLAKFITSSARSDGLLNISADDFFSIVLPVPSNRNEQQKIADCLSSLDELIRVQTEKIEALKAHKKGLIQQLFPQEVE
ncbi:hypothetical protein Rxycam_01431 [Rubrobacter xylanophilus DSM 9941]|uniref:restriction endonuclease subunit S n=1 Tax=Rubrobacter xylanophilus TaxID=49319 RepID=UPI001C63B833|nr:restriction endonuclease subunit S [Rubrobacter xylanophilus]QYJ15607.1 hypothetical protein Rxycam_01431 [Rubrobacter xylanophilus DSM 9941]